MRFLRDKHLAQLSLLVQIFDDLLLESFRAIIKEVIGFWDILKQEVHCICKVLSEEGILQMQRFFY